MSHINIILLRCVSLIVSSFGTALQKLCQPQSMKGSYLGVRIISNTPGLIRAFELRPDGVTGPLMGLLS